MSIVAQQLWFTAPHAVEIRAQPLPALAAGEMLVQTLCSAVSAGTELLVYRGQLPSGLPLDATLPGMQQDTSYPLHYGYACVGRVAAIGAGVDTSWRDKLVFAFQPHASHFISQPAAVLPVPAGIAPESALFLANMETAVNLVQDGNPGLGERVVVLGQGIVGLLLLQLLQQFPLGSLAVADALAPRRQRALAVGAHRAIDPHLPGAVTALQQEFSTQGADLVYEVSGVPDALNLAIALTGFASRIVIGSWYGSKTAAVQFGGAAHRNRLQITTSQVSTLAPELSGRWDKQRRFAVAWQQLRTLRPEQWISERVPLAVAPALYQRLHEQQSGNTANDSLQAIFVYEA